MSVADRAVAEIELWVWRTELWRIELRVGRGPAVWIERWIELQLKRWISSERIEHWADRFRLRAGDQQALGRPSCVPTE